MTHQLNLFLLSFGALQGGLLSLWMLRNQPRRLSNVYFALFLIVVGLQLTFKVITKSWLMSNVGFFYQISYKLPYLIGPLIYLYIKARKENRFRATDLLHFIPFAVSLALTPVLWYFRFYLHPYAQAALQIFSLAVYGYLALQLSIIQVRRFITIAISTEIVIAITLSVMHVYYGQVPDIRLLFLVLTLLIYWISYSMLSTPDLFFETEAPHLLSLGMTKKPKYAHSSLTIEEAARIENSLQQIMLREKPFLDSSLTIDSLALKLGTSRHHLSQVLNDRLQKSYVDFITDARLEEARRRLADPANYRFTIAAVALDSGFNSVSSFNDVFKKRYGTTPSKFRDQQLNKMSA